MRLFCLMWVPFLLAAQPAADPAYALLSEAYKALHEGRYDTAIVFFQKGIAAAPERVAARKDLAYTYLKTGQREAAREQFAEAMRRAPRDLHVALEYAFLCHETGQTAKARRIFNRVRHTGDADGGNPQLRSTAEQAFQNIDRPLEEGIRRWSAVVESRPDDFAAHLELARMAEKRDEIERAAQHFAEAWRVKPQNKSLLLDLSRVWRALNRLDLAAAAALAASRCEEARTAELGRELLPARYPWVNEFRSALELDPLSAGLRRDLAYLLLATGRKDEAEREFATLLRKSPNDVLTAAQLGFLLLERGEKAAATRLLEQVLKGSDEALANRVRMVLRMPLNEAKSPTLSVDAKVMAERSLKAGFVADALRYLNSAYEADAEDSWVQLQLGWVHNMLHDDREAMRWFDRARRSADPRVAAEAGTAWRSLRGDAARIRTTVWTLPMYSSRWHDLFSYGQVKTEFRLGRLPVRPYLSTRFLGDVRRSTGGPVPQMLSEKSVIFGVGVATRYWKGLVGWAEAGQAVSYLSNPGRRIRPDYRGGVSYAKGVGRGMGSDSPGLFYELNADAVFVSRFENDTLIYGQNRLGVSLPLGPLKTQLYWVANATGDTRHQAWANYVETGPGVRLRLPYLPKNLLFSFEAVRGAYTVPQDGLRAPQFYDFRVGLWYAGTY